MKFCLLFLLTFSLARIAAAQVVPAAVIPDALEPARSYLVGPGDEITGKVMGESVFDFVAVIDEDGNFQIPFFDRPVAAQCRSEKELRAEVVRLLSRYLKSPQVSVRVTQRKSRPPAVVYGEVRSPQQVDLRRNARLLEMISFAGGETERANGTVQVFRTQSPMCMTPADKENDWIAESGDGTSVPSRQYSLATLRSGREETNPMIYPGDLIVVQKSSPVYVIGEVNALREIPITSNGLSLTEAIAQSGGFSRQAKTKTVTIRRLKANSKEREPIVINYDLIKNGTQKDLILEPYDIVEVDKAKKSIAQTVLELATGTIGQTFNMLPQRVFY